MNTPESPEIACCAHQRILRKDNEINGTVTREWWECSDCKTEFTPAAENQRLSDMEAKYHDDIQCRDTMLDTATATIARQVEELAAVKDSLRQVNEVLVVNWVGPRKDGDYTKALADLVTFNIQIHDDPQVSEVAAKRKQERDALRDGLEKLAASLPTERALDLAASLLVLCVESKPDRDTNHDADICADCALYRDQLRSYADAFASMQALRKFELGQKENNA